MDKDLSATEHIRYNRHLKLNGFSIEEQLRLKQARVLVIGAGGLGAPVLTYLAAAGVGCIGIIDPDRVSLSNLQRQVIYKTEALGQLKVKCAKAYIEALNPHIKVEIYAQYFNNENALSLLANYDLVVDGSDNFPTRYLVNDACVLSGIPYIYGSIYKYEGQVSVFNALRTDGSRGPNYRDLYPEPPKAGQIPNCAEGGVLGTLAGIIGSLQANEAIKVICQVGDVLDGRLFVFDSASFSNHTIGFPARPHTLITELIDYQAFCGMPALEATPSVDVASFLNWKKEDKDFFLLDVRTQAEHIEDNIGGTLIPVDVLEQEIGQLPKDKAILIYCQTGIRSARAVELLLNKTYEQVYHLEGGINAYRAYEAQNLHKP